MRDRVASFFGIGDTWRRPLPEHWLRNDLIIAVGFLIFAALGIELSRSTYQLTKTVQPIWLQYLPLVIGAAILVWRRRLPLTVMLLCGANMFITGITMSEVMLGVIVQFLYLYGFFSAVAWGHPRRRTAVAAALLVLFMFGWIAYQFIAGGPNLDQVHALDRAGTKGLLTATAASIIYSYLVNSIYFGGAVLGGAAAWRNARQHASLADQASTIASQSEQLQEQAVVAERLRIARELHDVVAHHVSVIGVQAGAARRVLDKNPAAAEGALSTIEASSRSAVGEMRNLLGTLRASQTCGDRAPEPGFPDIATLIEQFRVAGMHVDLQFVDDTPALTDDVPPAVGLGLYRTTQEALANVRRHSTSRSATVCIRLGRERGRAYAEAEVLDAGRLRPGMHGTGLGLLGIQERVVAHGGVAEIGPRATGGYRVRVRLPFDDGNSRHGGVPQHSAEMSHD
ncbi:sensor histidine kinase [Leekyejoonella antrihumi]|uniref:histidine kinase n=1 Tax=Leekyejoonella antrihumi TaxID=1660198 RepID=A0A563E6W3_9MICO|nr:histidine kinase [Leekyejoonella antrihumi]TWP38165.1 sensor histidine kinase [Leekyejoonella antrihumi]